MKVIELFGGIGACTSGLKNIGLEVELIDYVEMDKYAVKSFNAINGTNLINFITKQIYRRKNV